MGAKTPWLPPLRAGKGKAHRHRLLGAARQVHLAAQSQRVTAGDRHDELNLAVHVPSVEVAKPRLDLEPAVSRLEARLDPHPVDPYRPDVLQLHRLPQAQRDLGLIGLGKARISRRRIGLELAVVEDAHDVALLLRLPLERRLAADHELVLGLEVRRQVESKRREVAVVRAQ